MMFYPCNFCARPRHHRHYEYWYCHCYLIKIWGKATHRCEDTDYLISRLRKYYRSGTVCVNVHFINCRRSSVRAPAVVAILKFVVLSKYDSVDRNNPDKLKFHSDLVWSDKALGFLEERRRNKRRNNEISTGIVISYGTSFWSKKTIKSEHAWINQARRFLVKSHNIGLHAYAVIFLSCYNQI